MTFRRDSIVCVGAAAASALYDRITELGAAAVVNEPGAWSEDANGKRLLCHDFEGEPNGDKVLQAAAETDGVAIYDYDGWKAASGWVDIDVETTS